MSNLLTGLTNILTGGAYNQVGKISSTLNPLGTAEQQQYGGMIGQLMSSPTGYENTALAGSQNAFTGAVTSGALGSPRAGVLSHLMSSFDAMQQGLSFNSYLSNLAVLSGATSSGLAAQAQLMSGTASMEQGLASGVGTVAGYLSQRLAPAYTFGAVDPTGAYTSSTNAGSLYTGSDMSSGASAAGMMTS